MVNYLFSKYFYLYFTAKHTSKCVTTFTIIWYAIVYVKIKVKVVNSDISKHTTCLLFVILIIFH